VALENSAGRPVGTASPPPRASAALKGREAAREGATAAQRLGLTVACSR